ncbi:MAG TPA: glycosyltransferase family 4 protein [Elusimicrobiales bacterium]|nr:glycosyltransferase family 4 protein [Elusimicrobiales bacterium]
MERKLQIFHLDDGRELRGGQRQMLYLVKELNKLGHSNHVVCRKGSPLERTAKRKGFSTITLPYFFEWDPVSAFILNARIKAAAGGSAEPPVLHSHTSHAAAVSYLASFRIRCVRIAHRRVDFVPSPGLSSRFKYGNAHRVIAISRPVKDIMLSLGLPESRITVVNSTVDLDETPWENGGFDAYRRAARAKVSARFGIPSEAPWIGSLIALVPHKDPENFARAAALVAEKHPETRFIIAGEGVLAADVRRLVKILGIEDRFHLIGYYDDPYELLSAFDIFVLPSSEEGMGSVLIEAMNSSLPIVATRAGGITDVIEDRANGLLAGVKDPAALAAAQVELLEDPQLRRRIAEEGHRRRLDFSSPKMAELTLKIYEQELFRLRSGAA